MLLNNMSIFKFSLHSILSDKPVLPKITLNSSLQYSFVKILSFFILAEKSLIAASNSSLAFIFKKFINLSSKVMESIKSILIPLSISTTFIF